MEKVLQNTESSQKTNARSENIRTYHPPKSFSQKAHIKNMEQYHTLCSVAEQKNELFWKELARVIEFDKEYDSVLEWNSPKAKWFNGGKLNVSKNCLDKNVKKHPKKNAIIWEAEELNSDGTAQTRILNYQELLELTCQIANTLKKMGVEKGDRVALYMPMIPETIATMQACARIGAIHTVIFAGFSAEAIADRLIDCEVKVVVTANSTSRKGKVLELKNTVDQAIKQIKDKNINYSPSGILVYHNESDEVSETDSLHTLWKDSVQLAENSCEATSLDSEDALFILYTSGTTGKPKGLYHTQAGYLLWAHWSTRWVFDLKENDIFWCTADCGWITGHTYVSYGPLSNGATILMYEGAPLHPTPKRFWQIIDRHKVTTLYTAPTAIRTFMKYGNEHVEQSKLDSLRLLGTVGEPINPEAWKWFNQTVGKKSCPIVDTWWQTETGGIMISPLPGATSAKPGSATHPLPGIFTKIVDPETGKKCQPDEKGALIIDQPWPSMARGIWNNEERFGKTYWETSETLKGKYLTGDLAHQDKDGYFWISGRMDDVLNISGHRLGTAEVESALVAHKDVCEAAAIGIKDEVKGQSLAVFISLNEASIVAIKDSTEKLNQLKDELKKFVGQKIGAHAKPDQVRLAHKLPKTRSGKIMRRLLRDLASQGKIQGDTSTLEDFKVSDIE